MGTVPYRKKFIFRLPSRQNFSASFFIAGQRSAIGHKQTNAQTIKQTNMAAAFASPYVFFGNNWTIETISSDEEEQEQEEQVMTTPSPTPFVTLKQRLLTGARFPQMTTPKTAGAFLSMKKRMLPVKHYVHLKIQNNKASAFASNGPTILLQRLGRSKRLQQKNNTRQAKALEFFKPVMAALGPGKPLGLVDVSERLLTTNTTTYYAGNVSLELSNLGTLRWTVSGTKGYQECNTPITAIYGHPYAALHAALFM